MPARPRTLTPEQEEKLYELYLSGMTVRLMATRYGVSYGTMRSILKRVVKEREEKLDEQGPTEIAE